MTQRAKARTDRISEALSQLSQLYDHGALLLASDPVSFIEQVISEIVARRVRVEPGEPSHYREGHEFVVCTGCGGHVLIEHSPLRHDPEAWIDICSPRMIYVTCEASDCGVEFLAEIHRSDDKVGKSSRAQWYSYDCDEQFIEHANEEAAMIHLQHFIHECREDLRRDGQWPEGITDPELVPRWGVMMTVGRAVEVSRDDGPDFDLRRNDGSARGDNPIRIPEAGE